jgi:hypothetical protein
MTALETRSRHEEPGRTNSIEGWRASATVVKIPAQARRLVTPAQAALAARSCQRPTAAPNKVASLNTEQRVSNGIRLGRKAR